MKLVLLALALLIGGPIAAAETMSLKLMANAPPGGPGDKLWQMFKDNLHAKAGDRFGVELLVHGQVGGDDVVFPAIRRGRGQMGIAGENGYAQAIPEASVLNLPFLFSSVDECDFVYDTVWTPEAQKIAMSRDIVLLQWVEIGWMQVYGQKPVLTPDDTKGYRMRALPYEASQAFLRTVGADTIVLPTPDVIPSLQTGMIAGGESSLLMYLRSGFAQYAGHLTLTNHSYGTSGLFANKKWLEGLSADDRAIVSTAFPDQAFIRADTRQSLIQELEAGKTRGITVHELTPAQRTRWEEAAKPMHRAVLDRLGPEAARIYDLVQKGRQDFAARGR
ncbi:MAG: TRAP transporter substrate-binding protein [Alphaproteobacteria bacterium]|nr:TRAP transporter substrate-binding protein [Alphaproteobacteria bacterium]